MAKLLGRFDLMRLPASLLTVVRHAGFEVLASLLEGVSYQALVLETSHLTFGAQAQKWAACSTNVLRGECRATVPPTSEVSRKGPATRAPHRIKSLA